VVVEPSGSFLGPGEVAAVCGLLIHFLLELFFLLLHSYGSMVFFSALSLFSSLDASFFGCFQPPCWFFQMPFPSFVLSARFMLLGSLLRGFILSCPPEGGLGSSGFIFC
jgi:hypothetical protein